MELTERHHKVWSLRLNLTQRAKTYPDNTLICEHILTIIIVVIIVNSDMVHIETIDRRCVCIAADTS